MRRVIRHLLLAVAPFVVAGCAGAAASAPGPTTELTRAGEAVEVTDNAGTVRGCEYIAEVPTPRTPSENSMRELRNEAGRSGANLVLLVMESRTTIGRAEGYLCAD